MRIIWNSQAEKNVLSIKSYYHRIDPDIAQQIAKGILSSVDRLEEFPESGRIVPEIGDPHFREVIGNSLIHREYANAFPAKFVIEKEKVWTENWNRPHGSGVIDPDNFSPYPKNPVIAKFFKELGRVDELGSGVRNIFKYCGIYVTGAKPKFIEDDVFKTVIPLTSNEMVLAESGEKVSKNQALILKVIAGNPRITISELSNKIGIGTTTVENNIKKLKEKNLLERVGPAKGGYWRIKNQRPGNCTVSF